MYLGSEPLVGAAAQLWCVSQNSELFVAYLVQGSSPFWLLGHWHNAFSLFKTEFTIPAYIRLRYFFTGGLVNESSGDRSVMAFV